MICRPITIMIKIPTTAQKQKLDNTLKYLSQFQAIHKNTDKLWTLKNDQLAEPIRAVFH